MRFDGSGQPRSHQLELRARGVGILTGGQHPREHQHTGRAAFNGQRQANDLQTVPGDSLRNARLEGVRNGGYHGRFPLLP